MAAALLVGGWYLPVTVLVLRDPLVRHVLSDVGWRAARAAAGQAWAAARATLRRAVALACAAERRARRVR